MCATIGWGVPRKLELTKKQQARLVARERKPPRRTTKAAALPPREHFKLVDVTTSDPCDYLLTMDLHDA